MNYHSQTFDWSLLNMYLDRESQHRLMPCMRMKTCIKIVAIWGYASGPGWCVSCPIEHTRTHMGDCTYMGLWDREDQSSQSTSQRSIQSNNPGTVCNRSGCITFRHYEDNVICAIESCYRGFGYLVSCWILVTSNPPNIKQKEQILTASSCSFFI
jgi:hypothetical protein